MKAALPIILALLAVPVMLAVAYLLGRLIWWVFNRNDHQPGGRDPSDPTQTIWWIGGGVAILSKPVTQDCYAEATTIADGAARVGLDDLSERLRQALDEGFTSTDIPMRIRSVLIDSRTDLSLYPDLHSRSQALISGIDEAVR